MTIHDDIRFAVEYRTLRFLDPSLAAAVETYLTTGEVPFSADGVTAAYAQVQVAMSKATPWGQHLFHIGKVSSTGGALGAALEHMCHEDVPENPFMPPSPADPVVRVGAVFRQLLERHASGDWGIVDEHDREVNNRAVVEGERILSAYKLAQGETLWCITEWDRSRTTLLLPEDY